MFFLRLYKIFKRLDRTLTIIGAVLIITFFFPREKKFRYEFQKGKPWMHEVMIAPFNFPIYKLDNEIKSETDSLLINYKPFFNFYSKTILDEKSRFREKFELYWNSNNKIFESTRQEINKENISRFILSLMDFVYDKGIIDFPEDSGKNKITAIELVRKNVAEEKEISDLFTNKTAYEFISNRLKRYSDDINSKFNINTDLFFNKLSIEEYLVANVLYDEKKSNTVKESIVKDISLTKDMIQEGERIISTGELITTEKYRILESLRKEYNDRMGGSESYYIVSIGHSLLVLIPIILLVILLRKFKKEHNKNRVRTSFILILITIISVATSLVLKYNYLSVYIIPFTIVPIIVKSFYDTKLALFVHYITLIIVGFWMPNPFEFIFINVVVGTIAVFSLSDYLGRGKLFLISAYIILSYSIVYSLLIITQDGDFNNLQLNNYINFSLNGLFVLTSIPLIYLFEKLFGFISETTLMELSNTNQPLLRKLAEAAPGTFQHSLQVANIAEDAIFRIGGNALLIRVAALYHDIGKIDNSEYFIENLSETNNPHDKLDFEQSAKIIISHIEKGVSLGRKYNLPAQIIEFIRTHHGTTRVQYFYRSFINKYPEKLIEISKFSYRGPNPYTKEMAVLMMADSIEAASRSLSTQTEESINELVESIINTQMLEEQFNEADITFKEITKVKEVFKRRLKNIHHIRIEYPK